ncbi:MAG: N-acetyltransferase [Chloroflexota bacterium]|nr:N-acetyltransferase [Chloroflexota bacterium]
MKVAKARICDATQIHQLINHFAAKDEMLPRALSDIYENLRDVFVVRERDKVVACASLHIYWADMAEVRGVAVIEKRQKRGMGANLVQSCLDEASRLGIPTVFCLTYKPAFFERIGFNQVDKMQLPRKVWSECYSCPKFPNCDEVAMVFDVKSGGKDL